MLKSVHTMFSFLFGKKKNPSSKENGNCCLCKQALSGRILRDAWGNAAHLEHSPTFCASCDRILSKFTSSGGYQYSDGRFICGKCKRSAVIDGVSANRSRRKILDLLEKAGFISIPKNIEIVLTHQGHLSQHSRKGGTAGLTLTQIHFSNNKRIGLKHQIGVLSGLPKIQFEAILAHELLHVWQHEQNIKLSPMYTEGLCELGAFLIYSHDKSELAQHRIQKMLESKDAIYGNGFRLFHKKLEKLGWKKLLKEILENKHGYEKSILNKFFQKPS